ncbi:MAG TPA: AMP-binding protein, partial [Burkholderiaceae bacterium]|nr:AMP-binding protein [Burkholderiaceae bacterium]
MGSTDGSGATPWLAPQRTVRVGFDDGSFVLRSPQPLKPYARCVGEWIERWAVATPDVVALAERNDDGSWRRLTWRELRRTIGSIAQSLIGLNLALGRPVVVLSDNSVDHALLMLAAMHIGRPVCTVSSAYCRLTRDFTKSRAIVQALRPGLIYASDAAVYGPAIQAL